MGGRETWTGTWQQKMLQYHFNKSKINEKAIFTKSYHLWCGWVVAPTAQRPHAGHAQTEWFCPNKTSHRCPAQKQLLSGLCHLQPFRKVVRQVVRAPQSWFLLFLLGFQNPHILSIHPHFPTCGSFPYHSCIIYSTSKDVQYFGLDFF